MSAGATTRGSRAFVAAGVVWFACWNAAVLAGRPRTATVVLGLHGFVFGVIFGKAYALVPTYFDRRLVAPRAPLVHLPLAIVGVGATYLGRAAESGGSGSAEATLLSTLGVTPDTLVAAGALAWLAGVLVFVATLVASVRSNLTGRATGTSGPNIHRRRIDRAANAVIPLVLGYLLWGSLVDALVATELVAPGQATITVADTTLALVPAGPAASHVLAAGAATLLLFGIGFRLLPRLLVGDPRPILVGLTLATGAFAPAALVLDFQGGTLFSVGATLLAVAIAGYALTVIELVWRSERRRVGHGVVAAGAVFGLVGVALGWLLGVADLDFAYAEAHYRLAIGGFLGLTIVGVTYQFYPPAVGEYPGVGNRGARVAAAAIGLGLVVDAVGVALAASSVTRTGAGIALAGSLAYAWILLSIFYQRR